MKLFHNIITWYVLLFKARNIAINFVSTILIFTISFLSVFILAVIVFRYGLLHSIVFVPSRV
jgi:hypothetical protein